MKVFIPAGEAYPAERPVSQIKEIRPQKSFHKGWIDKSIQGIFAVYADLLNPCLIHCRCQAVAVIEEKCAPGTQCFNQLMVLLDCRLNPVYKLLRILRKHPGPLGKCHPLGTISSVESDMAGRLIRHKINMYVMIHRILEQIHDISVVGNGNRFLFLYPFRRQAKGLLTAFRSQADPAQPLSQFDFRFIDFSDNSNPVAHLDCFSLRPAHPAETG